MDVRAMEAVNRRSLLRAVGSAGLVIGLTERAYGLSPSESVPVEVAEPGMDPDAKPEHTIKFAVIGLDHNHILGITSAVQRGGGELVAVYSKNEQGLADFRNRFGDVKVAASE